MRPKLADAFADVLREQCPEALLPADDDAHATAGGVTNGHANGATLTAGTAPSSAAARPGEGALMGREAHADFRFSFSFA